MHPDTQKLNRAELRIKELEAQIRKLEAQLIEGNQK